MSTEETTRKRTKLQKRKTETDTNTDITHSIDAKKESEKPVAEGKDTLAGRAASPAVNDEDTLAGRAETVVKKKDTLAGRAETVIQKKDTLAGRAASPTVNDEDTLAGRAETVVQKKDTLAGRAETVVQKKDTLAGRAASPTVQDGGTLAGRAATAAQVKKEAEDINTECLQGSYWLTRMLIIRYMGFIYFVAFLVSLNQNKQLVGKHGLLPADLYLSQKKSHLHSSSLWSLLSQAPTLLWLVDYNKDLDYWLDVVAWVGLVIAAYMIITGSGNWLLLLFQWMLYHSLVNVGQRWFSFGWESQILETGFLTTFLCPLLSLSSLPKETPPSKVVIFAYRWLIFRIMLGAGLIKIRGDQCWHNLTCMNYHYETQPVPNPLSYYLHQSPEFVHKFEVLSNHFVELVAPFLLVLTRKWCIVGGAIQILFQVALIISGNLSFLNWLTILPSLACFDDASLAWLFSSNVKIKVIKIVTEQKSGQGKQSLSMLIRRLFNISFGLLIAYLSVPVVLNLLSSRQAMNTSFDPLRLVNTYGAFGSVTKKRTELIFQGTNSSYPNSPSAVWEEYEFKCKPGAIDRIPCLISPYHYRLDWLMWFAAFQTYQHNPWLVHLAAKLLVNDENTESLMAYNPFHGRLPPKYIRAEHYKYKFTEIGSPEARSGQWWKRRRIGSYLPVVSLDTLQPVISSMGWQMPKVFVTS